MSTTASPSNTSPATIERVGKVVSTDTTYLEWKNVPKRVGIDHGHDNPVDVSDTSDERRARMLREYLDALSEVCPEPRLMPLKERSKEPAIFGTCGLDSDDARSMLHTPDEAVEAIQDGHTGFALYAGKEDHGTENIVLVDHDDLEAFPENTLPETLTVRSGSGLIHETFVNDGTVRSADGKDEYEDAGEIRSHNRFCVVPGAIHPDGGVYHVVAKNDVATLSESDIPEGLQPSTDLRAGSDTEVEVEIDHDGGTSDGANTTNEKGKSLEEVREIDWKLDKLLSNRYPKFVGHRDDSRIDAKTVWRLRYHHFNPSQIASIWKQYRPRGKVLNREDYVDLTIQNCGTHNDRATYYDSDIDPEDFDWINDYVAFFRDVETEPTSTWNYGGLTQEDVWSRCTDVLEAALANDDHAIIDALPSVGKSTSIIKASTTTDTPLCIFTSRHDLYDEYRDRCETYGLDCYELPSFHDDCPTANGEHGRQWKEAVRDLHRRGLTASDIHEHHRDLFDDPLPCLDGDGDCPYRSKWDYDSENVDVFIGHYVHAYNTDLTDGRTVVFDEFPSSAFVEGFQPNTVVSAVSSFLQTHDGLPFENYSDLLTNRDDEDRRDGAYDWFAEHGLDGDSTAVLDADDGDGHALAPLMAYALLEGHDIDGWEYSRLEHGLGVDNGRLADRVAARNLVPKFDNDELHILDPPELENANGVLCLDGTPETELWQMVVDEDLSHRQVLSDAERREYLTDVLNYQIVPTTDAANVYSNADNVNAPKDGSLFDGIHREMEGRPSLITSMKAATEYAAEDVLDPVDDVDGENDLRKSTDIRWYGNFKGSNDFRYKDVGVVSGSQHYGDTYIEKWCAFANESVERTSDRGGPELEYSSELGNALLMDMREHEVFQAIMRFERGDGDGATVFVNTVTFPDWLPTNGRVTVETLSDGMKSVVAAIYECDQEEFTKTAITDHPSVHVSDKQVRNLLTKLHEHGLLDAVEWGGQANMWTPADDFNRTFFDFEGSSERVGSSVTGGGFVMSVN